MWPAKRKGSGNQGQWSWTANTTGSTSGISTTVGQWEGEDFRAGVSIRLLSVYLALASYHWLVSQKKTLKFNLLSLLKREHGGRIIRWSVNPRTRYGWSGWRWLRRRNTSPCKFSWIVLSTFAVFVSLRSQRYIQSAIPSKLAELQERELAVRNIRLISLALACNVRMYNLCAISATEWSQRDDERTRQQKICLNN